MAVNKIPSDISSQSDTSMVLNTLMYVNDFEGRTGEVSVCKLLNDMAGHYSNYGEEQKASYDAVFQYVYGKKPEIKDGRAQNATYSENGHPEVGSLIYLNHSDNVQHNDIFGNKDGAIGATFYSTDSSGNVKDVYVSYRGTGEGRWYDNGDAFSKKYSRYQQDAAEYFDYVMKELNVSSKMNVYVTGHSKGGNQAQFVTLASKYAYLVDKCISMDGEGFSPEAIEYFKEIYGEDFYEKQIQKMYSICGDNDYVNVLGIKVIPEDHTVYVKTNIDLNEDDIKNYVENSHALVNKNTGIGNLFDYSNGSFYQCTTEQREISSFAKILGDEIMKLPPEQRGAITRSVMSLLERHLGGEDNKLLVGLNGEEATFREYLELVAYLDELGDQLLYTEEGKILLNAVINKYLTPDLRNKINETFDKCLYCLEPFIEYIPVWLLQGKGTDIIICILESIADRLTEIAAGLSELLKIAEFIQNVTSSVKKLFKVIYDSNYRAAQEYLGNNRIIELDTGNLHNLAERLWALNGRLETLDKRLDALYKQVKWTNLFKLLSSDFRIGWSPKINNCVNYLNDTANRFEAVERQILNMMGCDFTTGSCAAEAAKASAEMLLTGKNK